MNGQTRRNIIQCYKENRSHIKHNIIDKSAMIKLGEESNHTISIKHISNSKYLKFGKYFHQ